MRHDTADFFSLGVLATSVFEAAGGTPFRLLELKELESAREQPLPRERKRHPRRVRGDPTPPPLLRTISRRPGAAGGIKYEVARVRCHKDTSLNDLGVRLDNIRFLFREAAGQGVRPQIAPFLVRKVRGEPPVLKAICGNVDSSRNSEAFKPVGIVGLPV